MYRVKLTEFEGPLDLLLYLVTKSEVNIAELPIAQITTQYLEYLDLIRELNTNASLTRGDDSLQFLGRHAVELDLSETARERLVFAD